MQETEINWETLERLRSRFLDSGTSAGVYWQSEDDLAHYHATFAARIGWKWDNALALAAQAGFQPQSRTLYDWGCGSGIAALRVLDFYGPDAFDEIQLWDHSALACRFAQKTIREAYPQLKVEIAPAPSSDSHSSFHKALVLVSHALNELGYETQQQLSQQLKGAAQVIFVEPGDHTASRKLIAQREALRDAFQIAAPCTHCETCPMLAEENLRHWCHFFGKPPIEAFTEGFWARFSQTMEIDLRSLPYSFLVLQSKQLPATFPASQPDSPSRLIGRPRQFKGYTRLLSCDSAGLRDLELQKRDDKQLWKSLKKEQSSLYQWSEIDSSTQRLKSGSPL
ncbi:small ribosomal subunit Rsm22 family protein [Pelagicoccus sp. SDUM812005]|uniref:small ribosomal subunit Rsm22 family protein n=1 Tax=Pelagicoccus sp. SDUM812005 TaxID=3041257 RepID=UPI00280DBE50|nr:small ribosomal subunit Rsm22 family protein [Pelagicoccus sp. SDUM812005]MDQ8183255.1 small ribosomal subunit Rsm22 family protein [Pelagicoccus sp. SDUM812005]